MKDIFIINRTFDDDDASRAYVNSDGVTTRLSYRIETGLAVVDFTSSTPVTVVDAYSISNDEVEDIAGDNADIVFCVQDNSSKELSYIAIDSSGCIIYDGLEEHGEIINIDGYVTYEPGFDDELPDGIDDINDILMFHGLA